MYILAVQSCTRYTTRIYIRSCVKINSFKDNQFEFKIKSIIEICLNRDFYNKLYDTSHLLPTRHVSLLDMVRISVQQGCVKDRFMELSME